MKLKLNFANFNKNWDVAKFGNENVNLQRIWNKISFEVHWKFHREKVFHSNEKRFWISKEIPQGMLGVYMCAQSTKDVEKWNLVVTSPNWLASIAKKEKKRKDMKGGKRREQWITKIGRGRTPINLNSYNILFKTELQ